MYPSSPISSSTNNLFHIPLSPSMQYENELFQYFHDHHLLQPSQLQFLTTPTPDHHHQNNNLDNTNMEKEEDSNNKLKEGCIIKNKKSRSRGTASKKDRHSKINTAQGPRDRRMRLSLDVARKFFNLQDLLGFDKASKTVEWLLNKSNSAVKELEEGTISTAYICGAISASASTSECEVISSEIIDESAITQQQQQTVTGNNKGENNNKKKAKAPRVRAAIVHPVVGKESRNQARARARERTLKKSLNNIGHESSVINSGADDLKRLGSWTPFEDQSGNITKENVVVENSNLVVTTGNWPSPLTTIFNNYHHNTEISHEHQWKLWEA